MVDLLEGIKRAKTGNFETLKFEQRRTEADGSGSRGQLDPQLYVTQLLVNLPLTPDERPAGLASRQMEGRTECETDRF
jgi:hypothetical protein